MDNVLAGGSVADKDAQPNHYPAFMKAFNGNVANQPQLESLLIPIGDGLKQLNSRVYRSNSRVKRKFTSKTAKLTSKLRKLTSKLLKFTSKLQIQAYIAQSLGYIAQTFV
ncbi:hypothetical protein ABES08_05070 [Peribacillus simplex]